MFTPWYTTCCAANCKSFSSNISGSLLPRRVWEVNDRLNDGGCIGCLIDRAETEGFTTQLTIQAMGVREIMLQRPKLKCQEWQQGRLQKRLPRFRYERGWDVFRKKRQHILKPCCLRLVFSRGSRHRVGITRNTFKRGGCEKSAMNQDWDRVGRPHYQRLGRQWGVVFLVWCEEAWR